MLNRLLRDQVWKAPEQPRVLRRLLRDSALQVIDVGARGGLHERWLPFADLIDAVGFEPDPAECERLMAAPGQGSRMRFLPYALGGSRGSRPFYLCQSLRCSSLLVPNQPFVAAFAEPIVRSMAVARETTMEVVPLDEIAQRERLQPDALKVDVQGAELEVLQGGAQTVAAAKLLELEVEFNPQYEGQPLFGEVDTYLRSQGFTLLGLRRTFWRRKEAVRDAKTVAGGQIVHGDVLYYNERKLAAEAIDGVELAKWLILLGAYRQQDFVLSLLESRAPAIGWTRTNVDDVRRCLLVKPRPAPRALSALFKSIGAVEHQVLRQWVDAMRAGPAEDWHDPDFF